VPDFWSLPGPFGLIGWSLWQVALTLWWVVSTATRHVAALGIWWVPFYWLAVIWLWKLGTWGRFHGRLLFKDGEDVSAFSPQGGRASWLGWAGRVIRVDFLLRAYTVASASVVGSVGAVSLLVAGVLGPWLLPLPVLYAGWKWWQGQPKAWER
jgi:hypothetical protein